jgi:hypothetical protein
MAPMSERPEYYRPGNGSIEAIDVIEAWGLGFCLGNVVKYVARAGLKGGTAEDCISDLRKARWYLERHIARVEGRDGA